MQAYHTADGLDQMATAYAYLSGAVRWGLRFSDLKVGQDHCPQNAEWTAKSATPADGKVAEWANAKVASKLPAAFR